MRPRVAYPNDWVSNLSIGREMMRRSFVIGRSPYADVVLADTSVARRHAEVVTTGDGRFHLTDCAAPTGTWRRANGGEDGKWEQIRQAFVAVDEPLRLGDHACTIQSLLGDRLDTEEGAGKGRWRHEGMPEAADPPRGRVERDPETGEIVSKRL